MDEEKRNITEVEIYNETYKIVNDGSPKYTQYLAKYVDEKMNDISQATLTVSSMKVAVLAALNIADELFKVKRELKAEKEVIEKETDSLHRLIQGNTKF